MTSARAALRVVRLRLSVSGLADYMMYPYLYSEDQHSLLAAAEDVGVPPQASKALTILPP
jgi:hypothetical protein